MILPEMLSAGMEALAESEQRSLDAHDIVIAVYLAMRAIEEIADMRDAGGMVH